MTHQEKYYAHILNKLPVSKEEAIVFSIVNNLKNRGGLEDAWAYIDDETIEEIFEKWIAIVQSFNKIPDAAFVAEKRL